MVLRGSTIGGAWEYYGAAWECYWCCGGVLLVVRGSTVGGAWEYCWWCVGVLLVLRGSAMVLRGSAMVLRGSVLWWCVGVYYGGARECTMVARGSVLWCCDESSMVLRWEGLHHSRFWFATITRTFCLRLSLVLFVCDYHSYIWFATITHTCRLRLSLVHLMCDYHSYMLFATTILYPVSYRSRKVAKKMRRVKNVFASKHAFAVRARRLLC